MPNDHSEAIAEKLREIAETAESVVSEAEKLIAWISEDMPPTIESWTDLQIKIGKLRIRYEQLARKQSPNAQIKN